MDTRERIFLLMDAQFKEQREFAAALGVAPGVISTWRSGQTHSYRKHLPRIAELLNTTVEYLLTGEEQKTPADGAVDGQVLRLAKALREADISISSLSDRELRRIVRMVAAALED